MIFIFQLAGRSIAINFTRGTKYAAGKNRNIRQSWRGKTTITRRTEGAVERRLYDRTNDEYISV